MGISQGIDSVRTGVCTSTTKPASPFDGQVIYMNDVDQTAVWDGTQWTVLAPIAGGRNRIINGRFDVWQRGTSFTVPVNIYVYTADRFRNVRNGSGTVVVSRQAFTLGAAPVAGHEAPFFYRFNQTVAGTGGTYSTIEQSIEGVRTFAGQTVTVSFWAKADSVRTFLPSFIQSFGSGGSTRVDTNGTSITLTTSWVRYTQTFSIPSIAGKTIGTSDQLVFVLNLSLNTTQTIDIWGVQVEAGAVATPFEFEDYGTTLAKCQRYFTKSDLVVRAVPRYANGNTLSTVHFKVSMRAAPTVTITNVTGTNNCDVTATDGFKTYSSGAHTNNESSFSWTASIEL